jgi:hypothetical protein
MPCRIEEAYWPCVGMILMMPLCIPPPHGHNDKRAYPHRPLMCTMRLVRVFPLRAYALYAVHACSIVFIFHHAGARPGSLGPRRPERLHRATRLYRRSTRYSVQGYSCAARSPLSGSVYQAPGPAF